MSLSLGFTTVFAFYTFTPHLQHDRLLLQVDTESCQWWPRQHGETLKTTSKFHPCRSGTQNTGRNTDAKDPEQANSGRAFLANVTKKSLNYFSKLDFQSRRKTEIMQEF